MVAPSIAASLSCECGSAAAAKTDRLCVWANMKTFTRNSAPGVALQARGSSHSRLLPGPARYSELIRTIERLYQTFPQAGSEELLTGRCTPERALFEDRYELAGVRAFLVGTQQAVRHCGAHQLER